MRDFFTIEHAGVACGASYDFQPVERAFATSFDDAVQQLLEDMTGSYLTNPNRSADFIKEVRVVHVQSDAPPRDVTEDALKAVADRVVYEGVTEVNLNVMWRYLPDDFGCTDSDIAYDQWAEDRAFGYV